ncbi:Protein YIF1B, partial [Armadillidium nasatum]
LNLYITQLNNNKIFSIMYDPHRNQQNPQLFEDTSGGAYNYQEQRYGDNQYNGGSYSHSQSYPNANQYGYPSGFPGSQFIQDPVVANMAMQYGQNLVGQGKEFVDNKIEKIVSVSKLKYYFAVDTKYVLKKLKLLFFPFTHSDWSIRYNSEDEEPVQPRYDINAPDLYIPVMAFVTYILVAGLCLGLQDVFSPDVLGIQASWAVVWLLLELGIIVVSMHITSIQTKMHTLHILALSLYKYVGMIASLCGGIAFESMGYYCILGYSSFASVIFMFRTLRCQLQGNTESVHGYTAGTKRRFYLLLLVSGLQPVMMWWLTRQLVVYSRPKNLIF